MTGFKVKKIQSAAQIGEIRAMMEEFKPVIRRHHPSYMVPAMITMIVALYAKGRPVPIPEDAKFEEYMIEQFRKSLKAHREIAAEEENQ